MHPEQLVLRRSIAATLAIAVLGIVFGALSGSFSIIFDGAYSLIDATMSVLALLVSRLIVRDAQGVQRRGRFSVGFWHLEPLVLALNGLLLSTVAIYGFANAVGLILSGDFETREAMRILYGTAAHPETRPAAYAFVKEHFADLVAKLPRDAGANLSKVAAGFCEDAQRADAEAFFGTRSTKYTGGPRVLKQTLERIDQCSRLKKAESGHIATFLKAY